MVPRVSLFTNLLLVSAALADPSSLRRENRRSPLNHHVESAAADDYSWAGGVVSRDPGTFTTVTGTFTVPYLSGNDGSGSAWVGIDGDTCGNVALQTGVEFTISGGEVSYTAWYEWYPDTSKAFSDITISAGDEIMASVTAFSANSGLVVIENVATGQTGSLYLTSSSTLCQQDVEWIVEDFDVNGSTVPFADFGSVTFTSATASDTSGNTYDPSQATILDIQQNGQMLTSSYSGWESLTVDYV